MTPIPPLIQTDYYKQGHYSMYPRGTTKVYSNLTPRKSRMKGVNHVVVFGNRYWIAEYVIKQWNEGFFSRSWDEVSLPYQQMMDATLGPGAVTLAHIKELHDLGYMPLEIKGLPEGTLCPIRIPALTITNTVDHAYWLVNFLETILSCTVWQPYTSATIAREYLKIFRAYAMETVGNTSFCQWQGHDFSMRGMSSLQSACTSGAGHLAAGFTGTDTVPALQFLKAYYGADWTKELVGASVRATEHAVMMFGQKDGELATFEQLIDNTPDDAIISIVSDTWSLPYVLTNILPALKTKIALRKGKVVIRPDSFWTDPVDCLTGFDGYHPQMDKLTAIEKVSVRKGVVESLWDLFGGTVSPKGYKQLASCIGTIYGDAVSLDRAERTCLRLKDKGFASTNWVAGIGSYTYQYNTRDTFGFAVKATYGIVNGQAREIFKDPVTDDGMKKSAKGLLQVIRGADGALTLRDCVTPEEEKDSALHLLFRNGVEYNVPTLAEIRARITAAL